MKKVISNLEEVRALCEGLEGSSEKNVEEQDVKEAEKPFEGVMSGIAKEDRKTEKDELENALNSLKGDHGDGDYSDEEGGNFLPAPEDKNIEEVNYMNRGMRHFNDYKPSDINPDGPMVKGYGIEEDEDPIEGDIVEKTINHLKELAQSEEGRREIQKRLMEWIEFYDTHDQIKIMMLLVDKGYASFDTLYSAFNYFHDSAVKNV